MNNLFAKFQQNTQQRQQKNLLQQQQDTTNKLNDLLSKSANSLMCGPTCQKLKTSDELKQKYLNAQTTMQTAPIVLEETKKNYYVYTESQPYYDSMIETELKNKAVKITELIGEKFNEEVANAETMNAYYNTALINSSYTSELLSNYIAKNIAVELQLKNNRGDIITNDRKTYYETEALHSLQQWNRFWWYIYYILYIVILLFIVINNVWTNTVINIIKIVIFLFLPYIIHLISILLYKLYITIKQQVPINIYNTL
jgi:hypothetical protein